MSAKTKDVSLNDIKIRNHLRPGDIGYIVYLHGELYKQEYNYGISFEAYVAEGLVEFYRHYKSDKDRVWICEHSGKIIGSLFLMHREEASQMRYFLIQSEYRGLGLGKKLMQQYMTHLKENSYSSSYLWTTHELDVAASLYKRHGFVLVEEKPSSRFGKPLTEQKYKLIIDRI